MTVIIKLHRTPSDDIDEILEQAFEADYDELILFGIKGEDVVVHRSLTMSRARTIGALEMAKYDLLRGDL